MVEEIEMTTEVLVEEEAPSNQNYIDAINKLKAESVSREQYNQLAQENKNLVEALVNGTPQASADVEEPEVKDLTTLRKELFYPDHELNDIEYVTKALELRERVREETGEDIFVAKAHNYTPGNDAYESAERTAKVFQECLDAANGSNSRFMAELQERTKDIIVPRRK